MSGIAGGRKGVIFGIRWALRTGLCLFVLGFWSLMEWMMFARWPLFHAALGSLIAGSFALPVLVVLLREHRAQALKNI